MLELRPGLEAHASGALWVPGEEVLLVADAHLGYSHAQRRRGQLSPVVDCGTFERLLALQAELRPRQVVFLGDVVHAPRPLPAERVQIEATIAALAQRSEIILVLGNHDRGLPQDFADLPVTMCHRARCGPLVAIHGDRPAPEGSALLALGHFHPAFGVVDSAGVKQKYPAFLASPQAIVLPAFSPFAAGLDVTRGLPGPLRTLLGAGPVRVAVATGARVVPVGRLRD